MSSFAVLDRVPDTIDHKVEMGVAARGRLETDVAVARRDGFQSIRRLAVFVAGARGHVIRPRRQEPETSRVAGEIDAVADAILASERGAAARPKRRAPDLRRNSRPNLRPKPLRHVVLPNPIAEEVKYHV